MIDKLVIQSDVAAFRQIKNHIMYAVASGKLKPEDKLPSSRELSRKLGINLNTVVKSYQDLAVMGAIHGNPGRGVFVSKDAVANCRDSCYRNLIEKLHWAVQEAKAAGISKAVLSKTLSVSYGTNCKLYEPAPKNVLAELKRTSS